MMMKVIEVIDFIFIMNFVFQLSHLNSISFLKKDDSFQGTNSIILRILMAYEQIFILGTKGIFLGFEFKNTRRKKGKKLQKFVLIF